MPWGIAAGVVGSVAGAAVSSAMSPGTSGGSGGSGGPSYYVPTGLGSADQSWQGLLTQQQQNQLGINGLMPYYQQSLNGGLNAAGAYSPGYQNAANGAGQTSSYLAGDFGNQAIQNWGVQQELLNAGNQVYQNSLDPQSALYNRTAQQLQDQTGATNSMYGLGSSAAGAGVANQAMSNFNIDWNAQQLQNQIAGLGAFGSAASTGAGYGQLANQQASQVPGYQLAGGSTPYNTALGIAGAPGSIAGQYASGVESGPLSSASSINGQIIPYLNYGQGAQSVPYQQANNNAQSLGSTVASGIGGIGNAVQNAGGFSNLFSGTTGSFGGGDFSGAFTSSPYYSGGGNSYGFTM